MLAHQPPRPGETARTRHQEGVPSYGRGAGRRSWAILAPRQRADRVPRGRYRPPRAGRRSWAILAGRFQADAFTTEPGRSPAPRQPTRTAAGIARAVSAVTGRSRLPRTPASKTREAGHDRAVARHHRRPGRAVHRSSGTVLWSYPLFQFAAPRLKPGGGTRWSTAAQHRRVIGSATYGQTHTPGA